MGISRSSTARHHDSIASNRVIDSVSDLNRDFCHGLQIGSVQNTNMFPLSAPQLGIWFAQQINPSTSAYNIGEYIEICGSVDPVLFKQALQQVITEAEALRLKIIDHVDGPRQIIAPPSPWSMPVIDVSAQPDARAAAELWMRADLARSVNPTEGPLFGFALFKVSASRFFWYARYHHIVMDAFGMWLIARRLADMYTQLSDGRATYDHSLGSIAALLEEDAAYRASKQCGLDRAFWTDYLAGRPEPASLDGHPSSAESASFLRNTSYLPRRSLDRLRCVASHTATGIPQIINAAASIFLHRLTGANDVIFGLPVAARNGVSRCTPGMVSNVLPLRVPVRPNMTVSDVLVETSRQMHRALKHQHYGIADLRRVDGANGRPLFKFNVNIMRFNYAFSFAGHNAIAHNLSLEIGRAHV